MLKSIIINGLLAVMGISLMLATAQAETGFDQLLWSGSCLAVCGGSMLLLKKVDKEMEEEE